MKKYKLLAISFLLLYFLSCTKFLEEKPNATLSTPSTLQDLRGLVDNYQLNTRFPACAEVMSDNYYLTYESWNSIRRQYHKDYYVWKPTDENISEWNIPYHNIYTCNLVLESLKTISYPKSQLKEAYEIKATALFFRASYFFSLLQLFAKAYIPATAGDDPGIPLRLTTSFNEQIQRNSIKECYTRIIADLTAAAQILPDMASIKSRPSKAACFGALSRTFLVMHDFENALLYSDSCLSIYDELLDYSGLDTASSIPIERFNEEVIFQAVSVSAAPLSPRVCRIDTILYNSYSNNDLRKKVFYIDKGNSHIAFKGDYDGSYNNGNGHNFTGIATDEQYLIKAECLARLGNMDEANEVMNTFLQTRYRPGTYTALQITNAELLLDTILTERRKELVFRNLRLSDLKRLNLDPERQVTLSRKLNGNSYELLPNSERYVSLIPQVVIERSGIQQNP